MNNYVIIPLMPYHLTEHNHKEISANHSTLVYELAVNVFTTEPETDKNICIADKICSGRFLVALLWYWLFITFLSVSLNRTKIYYPHPVKTFHIIMPFPLIPFTHERLSGL